MRKTDRQTDRHGRIDRQMGRKDKQKIHLAYKLTNRRDIQTDRQLKEVERETERQAEGTNIQTERV